MSEPHVPARAPGHCDSDQHWSDFVGRHDRSRRPGPKMTDFNLANMVFLKGRDDLDLPLYQTAAKERIRWLSIETALEAERASKAVEALEAIRALSAALRQGGPAPEDLEGLSEALDTATSLAADVLAEIAPDRMPELAPLEVAPIPEAPWPAGGENNANANAKREGWKAFFDNRGREDCPFPKARADLQRDYRAGWDAANLKSLDAEHD